LEKERGKKGKNMMQRRKEEKSGNEGHMRRGKFQ